MRSLYVRPDSADVLPAAPTAVEQGTPLADMVTWLAETYDSDRLDKAWSTVAGAALALVRPGPGVSIRLAAPTDPGLAIIADAVHDRKRPRLDSRHKIASRMPLSDCQ